MMWRYNRQEQIEKTRSELRARDQAQFHAFDASLRTHQDLGTVDLDNGHIINEYHGKLATSPLVVRMHVSPPPAGAARDMHESTIIHTARQLLGDDVTSAYGAKLVLVSSGREKDVRAYWLEETQNHEMISGGVTNTFSSIATITDQKQRLREGRSYVVKPTSSIRLRHQIFSFSAMEESRPTSFIGNLALQYLKDMKIYESPSAATSSEPFPANKSLLIPASKATSLTAD